MGKKKRIKAQRAARRATSDKAILEDTYKIGPKTLDFLNHTFSKVLDLEWNKLLPKTLIHDLDKDINAMNALVEEYDKKIAPVIDKFSKESNDVNKLEIIFEIKDMASNYLNSILNIHPILNPEYGKILKVNENECFTGSEIEAEVKAFVENTKELFNMLDGTETVG